MVLLVIGFVLLAIIAAQPREFIRAVEQWDTDLFVEAALEAADIDDTPVASAVTLLNEAGFDGQTLATDLLLLGVPSTAFALPNYSPFDLSADQQKQRLCLAQAIYYEARNQPVLGRLAVADVVLNRVNDRRFPGTICGVVFQGQGRSYGCQFSFACDGSMNRAREPMAWDKAEKLADLIYRGFRPPLTQLATFYHANYVAPYWAKAFNETTVIGDHIFYRPPGAIEIAANQLGLDLDGLASS